MANSERARSGWLSLFLFLLVVSTTALLLGLLTPSWQVVYLEDGRTEHHHGLWLDCKRDFSYDYGRSRDYYETLHRRFDLAGPFDQFWLPALLCVFKFDFWLDEEDWYEHGYDENRLWGDAYQHLFLGWKIAALAAHLISAICALFAVVTVMCAYCHRLCTCVAAVLVTLAVLAGLAGNVVFYMFASDQDNNIIKEEEGLYEQHFGWSFWVSLIGNCLMMFTSLAGCMVTKAVLSKNRTKFVKIQVEDFDDDSTQLVRLSNGGSSAAGSQNQPFRRSRSTIYKIDSKELRNWERETMRSMVAQQRETKCGQFKRTNSMPMIHRWEYRGHHHASNSDLSHALSEPPHEFVPRRGHFSGPQMPPNGGGAVPSSMDVIYEYVDQPSISMASTLKAGDASRNNVYDPVPVGSEFGTSRPQQQQRQLLPTREEEYLQPKSLSSDSSSLSAGRQTPLIVPLAGRTKGFSHESPGVCLAPGTSTFVPSPPHIPLATFPSLQRQKTTEVERRTQLTTTTKQPHIQRPPPPRSRSGQRICAPAILSEMPPVAGRLEEEDSRIRINTFQQPSDTSTLGGGTNNCYNRSIADLLGSGDTASPVCAFERATAATESPERRHFGVPPLTVPAFSSTTTTSTTLSALNDRAAPPFLGIAADGVPPPMSTGLLVTKGRLDSASTLKGYWRTPPSEADRSIGSSRTATFLGTAGFGPPANLDLNVSGASDETVVHQHRRAAFGKSGTDV